MDVETRCVHAGERIDPVHGAVNTPIVHSTTHHFPRAPDGNKSQYIYSRYENPTTEVVEEKIAAIEECKSAILFSSGLAAANAILQDLLLPGDRLILQRGTYGGTQALLKDEFEPRGVEVIRVDQTGVPKVPQGTKVVWMESITNPLLRVADVAAWAKVAHAVGAILVVDATFATPLTQRPLQLGADYVLHSATKYLNGHSDVTAGVVCTNVDIKRLWGRRRNLGAILDPLAASLLGRGLKTLHVRYERQRENAGKIAAALEKLGIRVYYPGLASHPDFATASRVLTGGGAMVTLDVGDKATAVAIRERLELIHPAASLGGVESLLSLPIETSHAYSTAEDRAAEGITDGLIRISVGIEKWEDILADLQHAMA